MKYWYLATSILTTGIAEVMGFGCKSHERWITTGEMRLMRKNLKCLNVTVIDSSHISKNIVTEYLHNMITPN